MSLSRSALALVTTIVALAASSAFAQPAMTRYPGGDYPGGAPHTPQYSPFIDQDYFDVDWQWFAPAEVGMYGGGPRPNTGWYFTYDRTHFNVTRSDQAPQPFQGDATWGNRIDIGFMNEDEVGWLFEAFAIRGPNDVEHGPYVPAVAPDPTQNPPTTGTPSSFPITQRINVARTSGVELSRVWRLDPFHYGTVVEPMLGVRFNQFTDFNGIDATSPNTDSPPSLLVIENNILGLQTGVRCSHKTGHWVLSNETRFAACQNWQMSHAGSSSQFVPVGDIRFEAAYEFSREFAFRVGWQALYYGTGIGRGDPNVLVQGPFSVTEQSVFQTGVTFGFTLNR